MPNQLETHVLIIGAGITGLLIAHGLQQAGIQYTLFEDEDQGKWRSKEWTIGIHWGLPLLEKLLPPDQAARIPTDASVDAHLDYNQPPNNGAYLFDGTTGQVLKDLTPPEGRIIRVSRRKLRMLCQEGVDIKWKHTLQSVHCDDSKNTVTATFTNGESYTGTLLVGADGPRSEVRSFLFASDPAVAEIQSMHGAVNMSMAISYPDAETAKYVRSSHPVQYLCIHPEVFMFLSMQEVPDPDRPETWKFYIVTSWWGEKDDTLDNAGRLKAMKDKGRQLAEPFRTALVAIPDDTVVPYSDYASWSAQPWDTRGGKVTLAGDSAHPMPPWRGQGGNNAIQDAHNLVEVVKKLASEQDPDVKATLQARLVQDYSDEVAKRGAEEEALTLKNGRMLMNYYDFKESPYMKQGFSKGSK